MTATSTPPSVEPAGAVTPRRRPGGLPPWAGGLIGIVMIVVLWWIASQTLYTETEAIPSPTATLAHFFDGDDWDRLQDNFTPTTEAALWGFLWGNLIALLAASVVLLLPPVEEVVNQVAIVTYCLPPVAIGPIIVAVAGPENQQAAPIILASLAPFFTTVVGALVGLRATPQASVDLVRAYGGSRFTQLRKVRVIAALPSVFGALKIAAPAAFLGAVLAEFLGGGGDASVGQALIGARTQSDAPLLWYLALASGAVAGIGYLLVGLVARLVTPWTSTTGREGRP